MRLSAQNECNDNRRVFCGNLSENVTDGILYELFQQAGPVESVWRPRDPTNRRPKPFAFIVYKHECSVPYTLEIFKGIKLFNRIIVVNSRSSLRHIPVLDTNTTEYTEPSWSTGYEKVHVQETKSGCYQKREDNRRERNRYENVHQQKFESRMYQNLKDNRRDQNRSYNRRDAFSQNIYSQREKGAGESALLAGLHASRGNLVYVNLQSDLQEKTKRQRVSSSKLGMIPDFDSMLQMGQQMLLPSGSMGMRAVPLPNMLPQRLDSVKGNKMLSSIPGNERYLRERDRGRRENHFREEHPYYDWRRQDNQNNHMRHDRGYSSSRSSHNRERRDRMSR